MFDLAGKTALVTGATGGIGGAIARALHGAGATVAISARQADKLEAFAKELGDRVHVLPCDLADRAAVAQLIDQAVGKLTAARHPGQQRRAHRDNLFMVMKDDQWDEVIAVNLTSTFMLCRAAARAMLRRTPRLRPHHQYRVGLRACSAIRGRAITLPRKRA